MSFLTLFSSFVILGLYYHSIVRLSSAPVSHSSFTDPEESGGITLQIRQLCRTPTLLTLQSIQVLCSFLCKSHIQFLLFSSFVFCFICNSGSSFCVNKSQNIYSINPYIILSFGSYFIIYFLFAPIPAYYL